MLRLALPLVACAAFLIPASAQAAPYYEVDYTVGLDATASWSYSRFVDHGGGNTDKVDATVTAKVGGSITDVLFRNGELLSMKPTGLATIEVSGGATVVQTRWNAVKQIVETTTDQCTAVGGLPGGAAHIAKNDPGVIDTPNAADLVVRLTTAMYVQLDCAKTADAGFDFAAPQKEFPEGEFDADFALPHEAVGMGTIIQNVGASVSRRSPQFCPGMDAHVTACSFNWTGKLTFDKQAEYQYGIETLPPADTPGLTEDDIPMPPAKPTAPVTPPVTPVPTANGAPGVLLPAAAKVSPRGDKLTFKVTCPAGCSGKVVIAGTQLRVRFGASARPRTATVKVPRSLRRAARTVKTVKVTLTPLSGGREVSRKLRLR